MRPEPIFAAVEAVDPPRPLFLLGPGGRRFDQALAAELAAGRRVQPAVRPLRGRRPPHPRAPRRRRAERRRRRAGRRRGRRLPGHRGRRPGCVPGVMGNDVSPVTESFGERGLLEEPQFTRPAEFRGWEVPDDPAQRRPRAHRPLAPRPGPPPHARPRPDLVAARGGLTDEEQRLLEEFPPSRILEHRAPCSRTSPFGLPPTRSRNCRHESH